MAKPEKKPMTLYLPKSLIRRVKLAAVDLETSSSRIVENALEEYLKKLKKKPS